MRLVILTLLLACAACADENGSLREGGFVSRPLLRYQGEIETRLRPSEKVLGDFREAIRIDPKGAGKDKKAAMDALGKSIDEARASLKALEVAGAADWEEKKPDVEQKMAVVDEAMKKAQATH